MAAYNETARVALVLSGGGAKGAFEYGALQFFREMGFMWDLIAGVSVGSLNGTMVAMDKFDILGETWRTITPKKVYTGHWPPTLLYVALRSLVGKNSVLNNDPLSELLVRHFDPAAIQTEIRAGAVSLESGEYVTFRCEPGGQCSYRSDPGTEWIYNLTPEQFRHGVLASTAMPLIWPPVDIQGDVPDLSRLVDGGIRTVSPLSDVVDENPDLVVIINCGTDRVERQIKPDATILGIGYRSLVEIAINEVFRADLAMFLTINRLVRQADGHITLTKDDGTPYKYFESIIVQPEEPLLDTMAFGNRPALDKTIKLGYTIAEKKFKAWQMGWSEAALPDIPDN